MRPRTTFDYYLTKLTISCRTYCISYRFFCIFNTLRSQTILLCSQLPRFRHIGALPQRASSSPRREAARRGRAPTLPHIPAQSCVPTIRFSSLPPLPVPFHSFQSYSLHNCSCKKKASDNPYHLSFYTSSQ